MREFNRGGECMYATTEERAQALKSAAAILKHRWPQVQAAMQVEIGPNDLAAHASLLWPGAAPLIEVRLKYDGRLVARSLPSQPTQLDGQAFE